MTSRREEKERLRAERMAAHAHDQASARRRLIAGYAMAGLLAAAVLAGLVIVVTSGGGGSGTGGEDLPDSAHIQAASGAFENLTPDDREGTTPPAIQFGDLEESAQLAGCEVKLGLSDEGNGHFTDEAEGDQPGAYKTVPPTSGDHFGAVNETSAGQIADGAFLERPPTGRFVHSMEHGRVEIHYDPKLPENQQLAIKGVFDEDPDGMLMFPDNEAPYAPEDKTRYAVAVTAWTNMIVCPAYDPIVLDVIRNFRDTFRGNGPEPVPISL